jgi:hypothetical protein
MSRLFLPPRCGSTATPAVSCPVDTRLQLDFVATGAVGHSANPVQSYPA